MTSMQSLPTNYGLPGELDMAGVGANLPAGAKAYSARVAAQNNPSISTTFTYSSAVTAANVVPDIYQQVQDINFEIPCNQSDSMFLDTRLSTLNFQLNCSCTSAGTTNSVTSMGLRGSAYSFFDACQTKAQNGIPLEQVSGYGLTAQTLLDLQQSWSDREGLALMYGFNNASSTDSGIKFPSLAGVGVVTNGEQESFSIPLLSSVVGVLNDRFVNIGRTKKLTHTITSASVLPLTIVVGTAGGTPATYNFTLSNFSLSLALVDIGPAGLDMFDRMLVTNDMGHKCAYSHGTTYKMTSTSMLAGAASQKLPVSIPGSSVRSVFCRFQDTFSATAGITTAQGMNGMYDSKNPGLTSISFDVGGMVYPQCGPINPLLAPAQVLSDLMKAIGNFNSSQFKSNLDPANFCKLAAGVTVPTSALTTNYIDQRYTTVSNPDKLCCFVYGQCFDVIAKRGVRAGTDLASQKVNLNLTNYATTSPHTIYLIAMLDNFIAHDVVSGDMVAYQ